MQIKGTLQKGDSYRRIERKDEVSKNGNSKIKENCGGKHKPENDGM